MPEDADDQHRNASNTLARFDASLGAKKPWRAPLLMVATGAELAGKFYARSESTIPPTSGPS